MITTATVGRKIPNAEDELDPVKYERFIKLVKSSADKLFQWRQIRKEGQQGKADVFIGGKEGLSFYLEISRIDEDGDGNITFGEYNEFCENSGKSLDRSYQMLLNSGVVGTLLLSFLYPMAFADLQPSDAAITILGDEGVMAVYYIYYIILHTTLFLAMSIVFLSVRFYVFLGYWLIDLESKLEWLSSNPMVILAVLDVSVMIGAAILLVPGSMLAVSPYVGVVATFYFLAFLFFLIPFVCDKFGNAAGVLIEEDAERYLKILDANRAVVRKFSATNPMQARARELHAVGPGSGRLEALSISPSGQGRIDIAHKS